METTAKSLVLDMLAVVRRGDMPVAALVEAGRFFGLAENNVRVNVSNLFAAGRIVRDERGFYRLAEEEAAKVQRTARWIEMESERVAWTGGWVAVHSPRLGRGAPRARRERALDRLGFRELEAGLYVRPDNRSGGVEGSREDLFAYLDPADDRPLVYGVHDLGTETDSRARALWDAESFPTRHAALRARVAASHRSLASMPERDACVEGLTLSGEVSRQLRRDPMLPDEICDPTERRKLRAELRAYERVARQVWQPFMKRHGLASSASGRGPRFYAGMASV